jgi:hypothetical protein
MTKGLSLINFETRAKEDRAETMKQGHYVAKDVDFALITPVGGNLTVEQEVTKDLLAKWKESPETKYRVDAYDAWKEGAEPPVNGSDLKNWPPMTPAMLKGLQSINIRSVEELAELPDVALTRIGPGSRVMRDKARDWLKASGDMGVLIEQMTQMRVELDTLKKDNETKTTLIEKLSKKESKAA